MPELFIITDSFRERLYGRKYVPTEEDVEFLKKKEDYLIKMRENLDKHRALQKELVRSSKKHHEVTKKIEELNNELKAWDAEIKAWHEKVRDPFVRKYRGSYERPKYKKNLKTVKGNVTAVLSVTTNFSALTNHDIESFTQSLINKRVSECGELIRKRDYILSQLSYQKDVLSHMNFFPLLEQKIQAIDDTLRTVSNIRYTVKSCVLDKRPLTLSERRSVEQGRIRCFDYVNSVYDRIISTASAADL